MIDRNAIVTAATLAALPGQLQEQGLDKLSRLGSLALKAAALGDPRAAFDKTGMTPAVAQELLEALLPVASAKAQVAVVVDPRDPKSVIAALLKDQVSSFTFTRDTFTAFVKAVEELAASGQAASAALVHKNFTSAYKAKIIQLSRDDYQGYHAGNATSWFTRAVREALEKAGVDPEAAGLPQPGPQML